MYKILGVPHNATFEQIRKRYKKLALLHHPDKNPHSSLPFSEIHEAYTILSDPTRRRVYDMMHCESKESFDLNFSLFMKWACVAIAYKKMYDYIQKFPHVYRKKDDIHIDWSVTLKDVYDGKTCCVPFQRETVTSNNKVCTVTEHLTVSLIGYKKRYIFEGVGHAYKTVDIITEDNDVRLKETILHTSVILHLQVISDDANINITDILSPYDLQMHLPIDLVDFIIGKHLSLRVFDSTIDVIYNGGEPLILTCENNGLPVRLDEEGKMSRGDLYIILKLCLPCENQIQALRGLNDVEKKEWGAIWQRIKACLCKNVDA